DADPKALGLRNVAVFDRSGAMLALLHRLGSPTLPRAALAGGRTVFTAGKGAGISFPWNGKLVVVTFDAAALAPPGLLTRAALLAPGSRPLAGAWVEGDQLSAPVRGWPLTAVTFLDSASALNAWYGALPLYLFVILGPALAGGWLAALFVGAFERQQKAAHAIRSLKAVRPVEAKLMVRLAQ